MTQPTQQSAQASFDLDRPDYIAPSDLDELAEGEALVVDVEGFEGPLDLLLALARTHKLDITRISILALAEQYLTFVEEAHRMRLELAADYLVMAAWLAFLKSKLLLPKPRNDEIGPSGEELAAQLAFRLKRLDAMRAASAQLLARNRLGQQVFARGAPEVATVTREARYTATLYDLLKAYADQRRRTTTVSMTIRKREVWSIKEARGLLERLLGQSLGETLEWAPLDHFLLTIAVPPQVRRTAMASAFGASLELTREGVMELRQHEAFAPLYMRRRDRANEARLQLIESAEGMGNDAGE